MVVRLNDRIDPNSLLAQNIEALSQVESFPYLAWSADTIYDTSTEGGFEPCPNGLGGVQYVSYEVLE